MTATAAAAGPFPCCTLPCVSFCISTRQHNHLQVIVGYRLDASTPSSISLLIWFFTASRTAAVINDWIRKLKFFEDTVALGTYQGNVFMVDMNTREIKSRLDGHTDEISAIDWDGENGFRFLSCRQKHPFPAPARLRTRSDPRDPRAQCCIHTTKRAALIWTALFCRGCSCDGLPRFIGEGLEKDFAL